MLLAEHPHEWSSITCYTQGSYGWNEIDYVGKVMKLKDTRSGKYRNTVIDSVTFKYELPGHTKVDNLFRSKTSREAFTVHLFVVQNARDHYLGEWSPVEYVEAKDSGPRNCAFVLLKRLRTQSQATAERYTLKTRKRSRNEGLHETMLMHFFPDFRIMHEPDCQTNMDEPVVQNGVWSAWAGNTYTVDFVLVSRVGCHRFSVESKYSREAVDTAALQKCRALRDRSGQRVVVMAGNTENDCAYLDMGPPQSNEDAEVWYTSIDALKIALQV
jgi:hypothetical protein